MFRIVSPFSSIYIKLNQKWVGFHPFQFQLQKWTCQSFSYSFIDWTIDWRVGRSSNVSFFIQLLALWNNTSWAVTFRNFTFVESSNLIAFRHESLSIMKHQHIYHKMLTRCVTMFAIVGIVQMIWELLFVGWKNRWESGFFESSSLPLFSIQFQGSKCFHFAFKLCNSKLAWDA